MGNLLKINDEGLNDLMGGCIRPETNYTFLSNENDLVLLAKELISNIYFCDKYTNNKIPIILIINHEYDIEYLAEQLLTQYDNKDIQIVILADEKQIYEIEKCDVYEIVCVIRFVNKNCEHMLFKPYPVINLYELPAIVTFDNCKDDIIIDSKTGLTGPFLFESHCVCKFKKIDDEFIFECIKSDLTNGCIIYKKKII